jgi:hypothetical protein
VVGHRDRDLLHTVVVGGRGARIWRLAYPGVGLSEETAAAKLEGQLTPSFRYAAAAALGSVVDGAG